MIRILTDSTCDLPEELIKKYDIKVLPLIVTLGEDVFYDGEDIKQDDIFEYVKKKKLCYIFKMTDLTK